jgi:hypothetical protein
MHYVGFHYKKFGICLKIKYLNLNCDVIRFKSLFLLRPINVTSKPLYEFSTHKSKLMLLIFIFNKLNVEPFIR